MLHTTDSLTNNGVESIKGGMLELGWYVFV